MINSRYVLARELFVFLAYNFTQISTNSPSPVRSRFKKTRRTISAVSKRLFSSEKFYFIATITLVLGLIVLRGQNGSQGNALGSFVHSYIEETAVAAAAPTQYADISSLFANNLGGSGQQDKSPAPTSISLATIQDISLQASDPASTDYIESFKPDQIVQYTIQPGDTISGIAANFSVSVNTIIWANSDITNPNALTPGQTLKIPPVSGVIHTIKAGDTVASLAKKYQADTDKILAFNNLQGDQPLTAGDEIIIPDGKMPGPAPVLHTFAKSSSSPYAPVGNGQCVAFVRAHGFASLYGDAYQWARYINTTAPAAGEAVVMKGSKFGHVALITAVKGNSIQIVEQNYYGPYIIDHRQVTLTDKSIVGFIR